MGIGNRATNQGTGGTDMIAIYSIEGRRVWQNGNTRIVTNPAGSFTKYQRQTFKQGQWLNSYPGDIEGTIAKVEAGVAA